MKTEFEHKIAVVKWLDCRMQEGPAWPQHIKHPILGYDVGFVIRDDENEIALALTVFDKEDDPAHTYRQISIIPKCQVKDVTYLEVPKTDGG